MLLLLEWENLVRMFGVLFLLPLWWVWGVLTRSRETTATTHQWPRQASIGAPGGSGLADSESPSTGR